jgi:hypothetical protein
MRRRTFVTATVTALAAPALVRAQTTPPQSAPQQPEPAPPRVDFSERAQPLPPQLIEPQSALERTFVAATENDALRALFRLQFLESPVALALSGPSPDAPPRQIDLPRGARACLIFTSSARATEIIGARAPRVVLTGREALERVRGTNVIININLRPYLTLDAAGIETFLALPEIPEPPASTPSPPPPSASAGPTQ